MKRRIEAIRFALVLLSSFQLAAKVQAGTQPSITTQPQSQTVVAGTTVTFTVAASGSTPLYYQWFFNQTNLIVGATNTLLTLSPVYSTNAGTYHAVASNSFGTDVSLVANLAVALAPSPLLTNVTFVGDNNMSFSFATVANIRYDVQYSDFGDFWLEFLQVSGAGEVVTIFDPWAYAQSRFYRVVVGAAGPGGSNLYSSNVVGYIKRSIGSGGPDPSLNLIANPLHHPPQDLLQDVFPVTQLPLPPYATELFKVRGPDLQCASFDGEIDYEWLDCYAGQPSDITLSPGEGALIFTETSSTATFAGELVQGSLTNKLPAGLSLCSSIVPRTGRITSDLGFPAEEGDTLYKMIGNYQTFSYLGGNWEPFEPMIYIGEGFWVELAHAKNWETHFSTDGTTGGSYTISNLPYTGPRSDFVPGGTPLIITQPQSRTNLAGTDATFNVGAVGAPTLRYKWFFGNAPIGGGTNATLLLSSVQPVNAGSYFVILSNGFGAVTSTVATLTVTNSPTLPILQIGSVGDNTVVSWDSSATGFVLQVAADLSTWTDVPASSPYTFPASGANRFFRLIDPVLARYSSNVVGYVDVPMGNPWSVVANPLRRSSQNAVEELFPSPLVLTDVCKVGALGLECAEYAPDFGWFDDAGITLSPGEGFLISAEAPPSANFIGDVVEGALTNKLPAGLSLCSSIVPRPGPITSALGFPAEEGDTLYQFDLLTQLYRTHTYFGGTWQPSEPVIGVGEGFWLELGRAKDWVTFFSVNGTATGGYAITNLPYLGPSQPAVPGKVAPAIVTQPQSRTNLVGTDATFSVAASGTPPLHYQW